jgi:hypothetical protein
VISLLSPNTLICLLLIFWQLSWLKISSRQSQKNLAYLPKAKQYIWRVWLRKRAGEMVVCSAASQGLLRKECVHGTSSLLLETAVSWLIATIEPDTSLEKKPVNSQ